MLRKATPIMNTLGGDFFFLLLNCRVITTIKTVVPNGRHIRLQQQQQQLTCSLSVSLSIRLTNKTQIIEAMVLKTAEGQASPVS